MIVEVNSGATEVAEEASRARINIELSRQDIYGQLPLVLPQCY
ncbi:MAG: hypothetical protein AB8V79_04600 [Candidatus Midichloria sp.]|uniref:Uncharacterized protein n=1 Tax=Hyalomma marginatum TaxID=34627 RepID=A0A8S4BWQ9_9ACAR|nr:hypothetical protein MHYMCMPASI_00541 [Hyalomma marginatum]CAG7592775.1 hypothetical protein MHYMCMPSP_00729 [Hyalomma marginatum]